MRALRKNQTWEIVELPKGKGLVGCKQVFMVKYYADTLKRYKTRQLAKGYIQTYGVDYQETFAPVAKMNTIHVLLYLVVNYGWLLQQFYAQNAFWHGNLEEDVFMEAPHKQMLRAWFGKLTNAMNNMKFLQSQRDHTLFIKDSSFVKVTILIVYVDKIIVIGGDIEKIDSLKKCWPKNLK